MIEEEYDPTSNEIMRHPTIQTFADDPDEQIISLETCLKKYHEVEKLSDEIYCSKCQKHREHSKSFETFRPPPILTIQLKRFKRIGNTWRKLQTMVEFPTNNLDLSHFVQDYQFLVNQDISC